MRVSTSRGWCKGQLVLGDGCLSRGHEKGVSSKNKSDKW